MSLIGLKVPAAILASGYDIGRWKMSEGATITRHVYEVRPGGIETVNCHARDWADRDTHYGCANGRFSRVNRHARQRKETQCDLASSERAMNAWLTNA